MNTSCLFLVVASLLAHSSGAQPYGLSQRVRNSTLRMPSTPPVPAYSYVTTNAFGAVSFPNPLAIVIPPGETNRLFVVERAGRVSVITNLAAPNRTVFMDISGRVLTSVDAGLLGMAFHPGYASNRFFYVFYSLTATTTAGTNQPHQRLARFETSPTDPNRALTNTEMPLITQLDQNVGDNNGGDLHFGPDGYLYVSVGDEGGASDQFNNGQRIDKNFFSGILRIDVDQRPDSLPPNPHPAASANYAVPSDNPFIGATSFNGLPVDPAKIRTEFYAVGLRNPWRFSFDSASGALYSGDVGQSSREEIDLIVKGGNYGWPYREGLLSGPKAAQAPPNFTATSPIIDYLHG